MVGRAGLRIAVAGLASLVLLAGPVASPAQAPAPGPAPAPPPAAAAAPESCVACHLELGDDRLSPPAKAFPEDIHAAKGFGCVACHGGDGKEPGMEAMDRAKGYIGKPNHRQVIQVCGRCHSDARFMKQYNPALRVDQVTEYFTSVHGRRLRELNDPKVATCQSCHPAHAIRPPSDPKSSVHPLKVADTCGRCHGDEKYMAAYKIPTDQPTKYKASVHWATMSVKGDLSAPTCNDCHGNHGASPPGVGWVGNVCGQCHSVMAELFAKSVHARAFAQMGAPGCATCHENHDIKQTSDELLGVTGPGVCAQCHGPDDPGGKAATGMRGTIDALAGEHRRAAAVIRRASSAGMETSEQEFDLNEANGALVKARAAIHAFDPAAVQQAADPGMAIAKKTYAKGLQLLDELQFRRKGLAVSVVIILAVIGGLVVKIRQLDRAGTPGESTR